MNTVDPYYSRVVCLAGGVGGARLADGLARVLPPHNPTVIVNTGDDFRHLGLTICPDLDTVMYTVGDVANDETGWGALERVGAMESRRLGGRTGSAWVTSIWRRISPRPRAGCGPATAVTGRLCRLHRPGCAADERPARADAHRDRHRRGAALPGLVRPRALAAGRAARHLAGGCPSDGRGRARWKRPIWCSLPHPTRSSASSLFSTSTPSAR